MKKIVTDSQSIEEIILGGFVYIDKTPEAYKLISDNNKSFFFSHPRRFGKSLFLSTLGAIFEGNKELFKEYYIYNTDYNWEKFPVLRLDFSKLSTYSSSSLMHSLTKQIVRCSINIGIKIENALDPNDALDILINKISKQNKRLVILIDEYDKPIVDLFNNDTVREENKRILQSFFSTIKSVQKDIRFLFITGLTRFSQMSIFSGLNNLIDISFPTREAFQISTGYTQKELEKYLEDYILFLSKKLNLSYSQTLDNLKKWYNGYRFYDDPKVAKVYNPFSIMHALTDLKIQNYWMHSGMSSLLDSYLKKIDIIRSIDKPKISQTDIEPLNVQDMNFSALLLQTGYLTIIDYSPSGVIALDFPNLEVRQSFSERILNGYLEDTSTPILELRDKLGKGDLNGFLYIIQQLLLEIPSSVHINLEKELQLFLFLVGNIVSSVARAEEYTASGRIDLLLETAKEIYIIELKYGKSSKKAIEQIEDKEYAAKFLNKNKPVSIAGVNYNIKKRTIDGDWVIKKLY